MCKTHSANVLKTWKYGKVRLRQGSKELSKILLGLQLLQKTLGKDKR